MREIHIIASGKVQGVFFRSTVKKHAEELSLAGFAKNLSDGRVEIVAQGEEEKLIEFLKMIRHSPGKATLDNLDYHYREISEKIDGFDTC